MCPKKKKFFSWVMMKKKGKPESEKSEVFEGLMNIYSIWAAKQ